MDNTVPHFVKVVYGIPGFATASTGLSMIFRRFGSIISPGLECRAGFGEYD